MSCIHSAVFQKVAASSERVRRQCILTEYFPLPADRDSAARTIMRVRCRGLDEVFYRRQTTTGVGSAEVSSSLSTSLVTEGGAGFARYRTALLHERVACVTDRLRRLGMSVTRREQDRAASHTNRCSPRIDVEEMSFRAVEEIDTAILFAVLA